MKPAFVIELRADGQASVTDMGACVTGYGSDEHEAVLDLFLTLRERSRGGDRFGTVTDATSLIAFERQVFSSFFREAA